MPSLNRATLQRPQCPACAYMHGQMVACPPAGVWLMAWSKMINGRRR